MWQTYNQGDRLLLKDTGGKASSRPDKCLSFRMRQQLSCSNPNVSATTSFEAPNLLVSFSICFSINFASIVLFAAAYFYCLPVLSGMQNGLNVKPAGSESHHTVCSALLDPFLCPLLTGHCSTEASLADESDWINNS